MFVEPLEYRSFNNGRAAVLFSPATCAVFVPDSISLSVLDLLGRRHQVTREHLTGALSASYPPSAIEETIDELAKTGFVQLHTVDPGRRSAEAASREPIPLPGISHLVMNVSHDCNLKCTYCYADAGTYGRAGVLMSPGMAVSLVDFLLDTTWDNSVMVTFFGGEPLLNFEAVEAAVERGERRAHELGKKISFALTTNATLLDRRIISFLCSHNMKLTASVDGIRESHDRHRKYRNGRGSYDTVMARLKELRGKLHVPIRATLTRGNVDVVSLMDHLQEVGFHEIGFAPVDAIEEELCLDETEMERMLEGFEILGGRFLAEARENRVYGFTNIMNLMRLFHQGDSRPLPCGAGIKLAAASPEGEFSLCHRFAGNEAYRIGSIRDGMNDDRRRELLEPSLVSEKPACRACWARHLCGGGCYYLSHIHHGNIREPHQPTCSFLRKWYDYGIKVYSILALENPTFLEKFTGDELTC
jgi:uncharacterized protein